MSLANSNLFKPLKVGNTLVQHRVVLSPCGRGRALKSHVPDSELMGEYYEQRSLIPGTMLIGEATIISEENEFPLTPGIYTDEMVEEWKKIISRVHKHKSYFWVQLLALGRQASPAFLKSNGYKLMGPSAERYVDENSKKAALDAGMQLLEMTKEDLENVKQQFVFAAKNAIRAGADGVEIHGASAWLVNQFLEPDSNQRKDEYGGSIENRSRYPLEIVKALIDAIGAEKVGIKFSPWLVVGGMKGELSNLAQYSHFIDELEKLGKAGKRLAYVHITEPRLEVAQRGISEDSLKPSQIEFHRNDFVYHVWEGTVIRVGNYSKNLDHAEIIANSHDKTLIAFGRHFISNPDLPERLKKDLPLAPYRRDLFYTQGVEGYTDYPRYTS